MGISTFVDGKLFFFFFRQLLELHMLFKKRKKHGRRANLRQPTPSNAVKEEGEVEEDTASIIDDVRAQQGPAQDDQERHAAQRARLVALAPVPANPCRATPGHMPPRSLTRHP